MNKIQLLQNSKRNKKQVFYFLIIDLLFLRLLSSKRITHLKSGYPFLRKSSQKIIDI